MVECYVRAGAGREYLRMLTCLSLRFQGFNPRLIEGLSAADALKEATRLAQTDFYVISDDDYVAAQPDAIGCGLRLLAETPKLGLVGLCWQKPQKKLYGGWFNWDWNAYWSVAYFGGLFIVRRDAVLVDLKFEPNYQEGIGEDRLFCEAVRLNGFDVGVLPDRWAVHLGESQSTVWPK
jgi:hypothetical protein